MSIQSQLLTLLSTAATLAGTRVYALTAQAAVTKPYITYQRISGIPELVLSGSSGLTNTRMQIDVYSKSYAEAITLAAQVDALMAGWAVKNVPVLSRDLYESEVKLYRFQTDYSIWH